METLEVSDLRARRRVLALFDRVFPDPVVESCSANRISGQFPVTWREPLFELFRETFNSQLIAPEDFVDLTGEWIAVQMEISDSVRVELFAMGLAWSEWVYAWSHRC